VPSESRSDRLDLIIDPGEHLDEGASQPVALAVDVLRELLCIFGKLRTQIIEALDLLAQLVLGVLCDRVGPGLSIDQQTARVLLCLRHHRTGLSLGFLLRLIQELLSE
jgi:hypothetical protein